MAGPSAPVSVSWKQGVSLTAPVALSRARAAEAKREQHEFMLRKIAKEGGASQITTQAAQPAVPPEGSSIDALLTAQML
eukprot:3070439-Prymnesium_polylepis.1